MRARATVHGAISIVNAIAAGRGATLGTEQQVTATVEATAGSGVVLESDGQNVSSRLVCMTVDGSLSKRILEKNKITVRMESDIPTGYGLKSSSAISSAVSLACAKLSGSKINDQRVLLAGVSASIKSKVSMTGAYDDACACYFGGFNVTDNYKRRLVLHESGSKSTTIVIFIPRAKRRGNIKRLRTLDAVFRRAWDLAKGRDYWGAMIINGLATSTILDSDPKIIANLLEAGAIGASVSGNGPAIAAVTKKKSLAAVKKVFAQMEGRTIVTGINNKKAVAHEL